MEQALDLDKINVLFLNEPWMVSGLLLASSQRAAQKSQRTSTRQLMTDRVATLISDFASFSRGKENNVPDQEEIEEVEQETGSQKNDSHDE